MSQTKNKSKKTTKAGAGKRQVKKPAAKTVKAKDPEKTADTVIGIIRAVSSLCALFTVYCYISPETSGGIGKWLRTVFFGTFGVASVLVPVLLLLIGIFLKKLYNNGKLALSLVSGTSALIFLSVFCGVFSLARGETLTWSLLYTKCSSFYGGGALGGIIAQFMRDHIMGSVFTAIVSMIFFIIFACLTVGITPGVLMEFIGKNLKAGAESGKRKTEAIKATVKEKKEAAKAEKAAALEAEGAIPDKPSDKKKRKKAYDFDEEEPDIVPTKHDALDRLLDSDDEGVGQFVKTRAERFFEDGILTDEPVKISPEQTADTTDVTDTDDGDDGAYDEYVEEPETIEAVTQKIEIEPEKTVTAAEEKPVIPEVKEAVYRLPPIRLLSLPEGSGAAISADEARANARKIVETLSNFGITVSVENISVGPTITRYELRPAPGVRIARIGNLIDDLARVLASGGVRFESSIEGKDTVGIEVPNKKPYTVNIRSLIDTEAFRASKSKVNCALGVNVSNEPVYLDIQKMPHMIIAGATGMGKSVCINCLIISILYRAKPDEVKLIMIDPKKVEFAPYVGIPHLLVPVITDMKKAAGALNWLVQEMERRYDLIEATGCRNIFGYNEISKNDPSMEKLPVLVIIIDELADLMATSKDNVESSIARIAAKARAAGMHLIIGTQRPDTTVISGTIKNNIPSRIACRVGSQIDSRTILDEGGAERLIGRGDMLYKPVGALKLSRLQGAFVSDEEVEAVVSFIKNQGVETSYSDEAIKNIDKAAENISDGKKKITMSGVEGGDDELLLSAIEISFDAGKVATSLLNRKLSIGYGRAAKIIDRMEEMGICSGANGSKPRELIMSREQFMAKYGAPDQDEEGE